MKYIARIIQIIYMPYIIYVNLKDKTFFKKDYEKYVREQNKRRNEIISDESYWENVKKFENEGF